MQYNCARSSDSSAQVLTDAGDHANIHANVRHKLYYKKVLVTLIVQIFLFGTKKTFKATPNHSIMAFCSRKTF